MKAPERVIQGLPVEHGVPEPPVRPIDLPTASQSQISPAPPPEPAMPSEKDLATCKALFDSGVVVAKTVPPIHGGEGCGIEAPIVLQAIVLGDGRHVRLDPTPTIRCDLAATVGRWLTDDVVPMLSRRGLTLETVINADAYSCRSRNHVDGAKLSEHARGNAIDIDALVFAGGKRVALTSTDAAPFASDIRAAACARFATVLGPGSDAYHNNHIHLDLEDRRTHGTLCQWRIPGDP